MPKGAIRLKLCQLLNFVFLRIGPQTYTTNLKFEHFFVKFFAGIVILKKKQSYKKFVLDLRLILWWNCFAANTTIEEQFTLNILLNEEVTMKYVGLRSFFQADIKCNMPDSN